MLALLFGYGIFAKILCISSAEKALIVSVRMLPSDPVTKAQDMTASASGASAISTASYCPTVQ